MHTGECMDAKQLVIQVVAGTAGEVKIHRKG